MSPLAGPLASSQTPLNAPKTGEVRPLTPTKDQRPRGRWSRPQLAVIARQLTERDQQVLQAVSRFRVMSGAQLQRLFWVDGSPQTRARLARRGLARLVRLDVLQPLARRVGGARAGSASTTYAAGRAGQYLLRAGRPSARRVRRAYTPGERYLAHSLAVAQLYVELTDTQRSGLVELAEFAPEPDCWRIYTVAFGVRQVLKPDAYVKLATAEYEFSWFIEIDMATEATTTIRVKAERYHEYYRSATEQTARGVFPRVLWIVPNTARAETIADTLTSLPAEAQRLFALTTSNQAVALLASEARS
ncbi:MAG TPA: replication-relaxation family protein [Solirubrobacteraceae bacterium]